MLILKPSIFNIEFTHNGARYLYNSKTSALAEIEKPLTEYIVDSSYRGVFLESGFAVEESTDEVETLLREVDDAINTIPDTLELTVVLTETCNFQCVYCYQTKKPTVFTIDDTHELLKSLHQLFDKGLKTLLIHYFGGEPLLNLSTLRILDSSIKDACKKNGIVFKSHITTNGSLLTVAALREFNFNVIQLTFDGDKYTHNLYKISNSFNYIDLLNTVDVVLKESKSHLRIRFNICKENADGFFSVLNDIYSLSSYDNNRVSFAFNPMRNYFGTDKFTELSPIDYSSIDLQLRKHVQKLGKRLILPRSIDQPCKFAVGNAMCIGPNCTSYFCTSNFDKGAIKKRIEHFLDKRSIHYELPKVCYGCVVLPMCLCACKLLDPKKNACIPEKYIIVELLKMYLDSPDMWDAPVSE